MTSLYDQMVATGVTIENHYSDMYVPVNETTTKLVNESGRVFSMFKSQIDDKMWYDIPFAYQPFWDKVQVGL
jgi:hypothetical protein